MVPREELLPEFVRFSNVFYRLANGWESPADASLAQTRLVEYLAELKARLAWELPLLCAFEEGPALAGEVGAKLEKLESVALATTPENLASSFNPALEQFLASMRAAEELRRELPEFTDIKVVNEMMLLASANMDGRLDTTPVAQRVPILVDWINRKQEDWLTYLRLFPDQEFRVDRVMQAFEGMRRGIGGIYLFLQGEDEQGLHGGLAVVLRALEVMAPAVETRYLTESERVEMSPDLRLERIWRGADWPSWEGTSLGADLLGFYQHWAKPLQVLGNGTLLPGSIYEETMTNLTEIQSLLTASFEALWELQLVPEGEPARAARAYALADLEACRKEVLALLDRVSQSLEAYRSLQSFPLYANVLGVLGGILREDTPDAYLHQLLVAIGEGQVQFQAAIEETADVLNSGGDFGAGFNTAAAQAASINKRFDLPSSSAGAELVLEGAYEVIVQPGYESNQPAVPSSPSLPAEDDSDYDHEAAGAQTSQVLDSAWQALEQQEQAQELLWSYLQGGDRVLLHDAYELFAEPFLALSEFVPPEPPSDESSMTACPYCQESFSREIDRCPNCKRLVTLSQRQVEVVEAPAPAVGSTLIANLDQRTRALSGAGDVTATVQEWRVLARRLESMAKAAKTENKGPHLDLVFAELVAGCHQVADILPSGPDSYRGLRTPLLQKFSLLEKMVGASAGRPS